MPSCTPYYRLKSFRLLSAVGMLIPLLYFAGGYPCCCSQPGSTSSRGSSSRPPNAPITQACTGCANNNVYNEVRVSIAGVTNAGSATGEQQWNGDWFLTKQSGCTWGGGGTFVARCCHSGNHFGGNDGKSLRFQISTPFSNEACVIGSSVCDNSGGDDVEQIKIWFFKAFSNGTRCDLWFNESFTGPRFGVVSPCVNDDGATASFGWVI